MIAAENCYLLLSPEYILQVCDICIDLVGRKYGADIGVAILENQNFEP